MYVLTEKLIFPKIEDAQEDGLLAIGGDLSVERLLLAYKSGIFPWYEGETILWWSPNPRFVLKTNELIISKSMQKIINNNQFTFTINNDFASVIENCKKSKRYNQDGTWITNDMEKAYINLHKEGFAISAEAWYNGKLVGGLYGVLLNNIFCGESMFTIMSNASKFVFIKFVDFLMQKNIEIIDCQVYTEHLESLGAKMITREEFIYFLLL
jgi:leucyl/phenylalanyl-tRNA---protein transferase